MGWISSAQLHAGQSGLVVAQGRARAHTMGGAGPVPVVQAKVAVFVRQRPDRAREKNGAKSNSSVPVLKNGKCAQRIPGGAGAEQTPDCPDGLWAFPSL